jgi:hypothetical protein
LVLNLATGKLGGTNGVEAALGLVTQLLSEGRREEADKVMTIIRAKITKG